MAAKHGNKKKKEALSPGERRRLRQLVICVLLFAVVCAGRGLDLEPVNRLSSTVSGLIQSDTDLQAVFSQVGRSFSQGEPAVETFRSLWSGLIPSGEEGTPALPEEESAQPDASEEALAEEAEDGND